jgi:hypothetical protein|tara:strand:+ start:2696 stop:3139 length:444 start_codon:yes stop_codon:yes gene_type:complete
MKTKKENYLEDLAVLGSLLILNPKEKDVLRVALDHMQEHLESLEGDYATELEACKSLIELTKQNKEFTFTNQKQIKKQLSKIVMQLQQEFAHAGDHSEYLLNVGTPAGDLLVHSTESEREFILHKLAPDLEVVDVYESNNIILKLKL